MPRKRDDAEIREFLRSLASELQLDPHRRRWPQSVFHFTDIRNAASVLRGGALLSRLQCQRRKIEFCDAANKGIIRGTEYAHKFVRLYFGPRTPTQWGMEGIRPLAARREGAHCPVPIFFIFDSAELLGRQGVRFTDGSMARRGQYNEGGDAAFLARLPFDAIYHRAPLPRDRAARDEIIFRRHAEVLVERELELDALTDIVCRTGPERDTLLRLLDDAADRWRERIRLEHPGEGLFERTWTYVRAAWLMGAFVRIQVVPRRGRFDVHATAFDADTGETLKDGGKVYEDRLPEYLDAYLLRKTERVHFRLLIEGELAYEGVLTGRSLFG